MNKIETRMRESPYAVELTKDEPNRLQAPPDHGSDRYTQWINSLVAPIARIQQQSYRRFFVSCQHQLEVSGATFVTVSVVRFPDERMLFNPVSFLSFSCSGTSVIGFLWARCIVSVH